MKEKSGSLFFINAQSSGYIKTLDGLRGVAIFLVLLTHANNWDLCFHPYLSLKLAGREVICAFFILSAYLVSRQFARALINEKFNWTFCKNYFARRFLRIYPLFILCLVLFGTIDYFYGNIGMYSYPFSKIPSHLLFIRGDGMFWAVAAEFKYYFALPLLLIFSYKICKLKNLPFLGILVLLNIVVATCLTVFKMPAFPFAETLPVFSLGCFIAVFDVNRKGVPVSTGTSKLLEACAFMAILILLMYVPVYFTKIFGFEHSLKNRTDYFVFTALWGVLLAATLFGVGFFKKLFELTIFRFLGTISYSLYLFHLPVLFFVNSWQWLPQGSKIYVFIVLSVLLASLIFLLIERPLAIIKIKYLSGR